MPNDLTLPPGTTPRHALVSGASSGIGRAVAESLLAQGWQVSGLDIAYPAIVHPAFQPVKVDLANGAELETAVQQLAPVQAIVHAAGILRVGQLGQLDMSAGDLMWRLHVDAATRLANALVPGMIQRGQGRVVFIGSRVSQGMPGRSQYAATKAALVALVRSWAAEVAAHGVTINLVSPAATQTSMLQDPSRATSAPRLPPIGRLIQPDEVAALVSYLLSPQAAAMTGQDLQLCGGASLPR
jgi:NAD(P)-dependent dehydrogenase (short-subunit alcohol dehydrogenase family)